MPKIVTPDNTCTTCLIGKQPRLAFKSNLKMRSKYVLNVVYFDICGPFEVPSIAVNKYFLAYVDEYSRMLWMFAKKSS